MLLIAGFSLAQIGLQWLDSSLRQHTHLQLQQQAQSLLFSLIHDEQSELVVNERHHDARYLQPFSGQYFIIKIDDEEFRSRSLWDFVWPQQQPKPDELFSGPNQQVLLSYQQTYLIEDRQVSVTVAENYLPMLERFYSLRNWGLGLGVRVLTLIILMQNQIIRHALQPLEIARRQLLELETGRRNHLDAQVPIEMLPLVQQINHLLEHLDKQLKRSRSATGNLGHALKTPLAILGSLLARPELQAQPQLVQLFQEQLNLIQQRIERELNRARLAGEQHLGQGFHADTEIPALLQLMHQLHGEKLKFTYQAPPDLRLPFDRDDLLELLGNLLDNAGKWAHSQVTITIVKQPRQLFIYIDDDGVGIPESQRAHLLQRGQRQDENLPGHGLGLAIVQDITNALQGELTLQTSPLGCLRVGVCLPLK